MTGPQFGAATAVLTIGAFLQGSIGFGMALFAAPLLALIDPGLAPAPLLVANLSLTMLMTWRESHAVRHRDLRWSLSGRVVGIVVAVLVIKELSGPGLDLLFAGVVLSAVVLAATGLSLPLGPATLLGAGVVSGVMGTTTGIGGPPMAIVYQREKGPLIRGTLSAYFTVGAVLSSIGLWWAGRFGQAELLAGLLLVPGVVLGFALSHRLLPHVDRRGLRPAILGLSGVSAVILIVRRLL
ncbi:MAG: TSUP family transporter [Gemmatimonadales bacterium]